jgi:hypothetical protein
LNSTTSPSIVISNVPRRPGFWLELAGIILWPLTLRPWLDMVGRVVLFVDYQNMYRGVREVFHRPSDPPRAGQIDPLQLGQLIVEKSPFPRDLA